MGLPRGLQGLGSGGIWKQLGDRGQNTAYTQTLACSSSQHAHPYSPVTKHLFPMGLGCTCHTSQLCDLAHCPVFSGSVSPTCPSFCKDVMSTSMCRRPEAHSGTYRTGEGPLKTAALVLTAVTGEVGPGRGLEDPYISLAEDAEQTGTAGSRTSTGREKTSV
ncbi:hypothetical protein HJG60_011984 [Phyllostomus discolor]|uniref:Uncharacterized protein n=1 Tax=Phyllostomus discolor TaxID=89673 RepID=A0A833ZJ28_9CHIR|nr:hypothetical protein HJG60_011984 [Phyllostomus discolor]